ncbi:MAG: DsbE family thiol:disulfide interchange protein [Myxococcota bacterium]
MSRAWIPLAGFLALVGLLVVGLRLNPREIPSPLIDRPAPEFRLPRLNATDQVFAKRDRLGEVWLLNVWASWCVACRKEHPLLVELARDGQPLYGLDYKDRPSDAHAWLAQHGDPYREIAVDREGRVGIDFGVYGVPETFLIDREGVIRFKQIGPLTREVIDETLLPLIRELQG